MEQFSLEKYLENPSRKVYTRCGLEAEIIHDKSPLVAIINGMAYNFENDGSFKSNRNASHQYDLFFADEEESMNEFETRIHNLINFSDPDRPSIKEVKEEAEIILELARNELKKKFVLLAKEDYQTAFDLGKAEILKDLPKRVTK